jgi:hypothetical protein
MKLLFCDPSFVLFASEALDETDEDVAHTIPAPPPAETSPFVGLVDYASQVRLRATKRARTVSRRRRAS